ncbi:hypothetical protein N1851_002301 [Merluccius polli]|uniref:Uncharacterized protein n=1 Tax=Merluccius polli TaxID=89951 RepID=A0AA47NBG6_MERPO|nr:hypothetical protein N1851_002301 [Merluccius polli]
MDELRLRITTNKRIMDCNLLIFTETWLNPPVPDNAINLAERNVFRADWAADSGKSKGGGLCIYVNNAWCTDSSIIESHCSENAEYLMILVNFYRSTIESILTNCVTVWYGNCSASDQKALQRVVKIAQRITGSPLPSIEVVQRKRCLRKARSIAKDNSHPNHRLFTLLPSGKRYRSLGTRTSRFRGSFFPQAVTLLNSTPI